MLSPATLNILKYQILEYIHVNMALHERRSATKMKGALPTFTTFKIDVLIVDSHHVPQSPDALVPWIASPMETWDAKLNTFSPRHEASTIELFFDPFFVANLATFTQYHAITNRDTFGSYVAFFVF